MIDGLARLDPQHPPLYYVLARLWVGLFGMGTGALRFDGEGAEHARGVTAAYMNLRKLSIYGGSNEIQKNIISQSLVGV